MKKEAPVESVENVTDEFKKEYTRLVLHHIKLRTALTNDFVWIRDQLKLARESNRSSNLKLLNEIIEYLENALPELKKALEELSEQTKIPSSMFGGGGLLGDEH